MPVQTAKVELTIEGDTFSRQELAEAMARLKGTVLYVGGNDHYKEATLTSGIVEHVSGKGAGRF